MGGLKAAVFIFVFLFFAASAYAGPKYIFLFIGDGMGLPQISAAEAYRGALNKKGDGFSAPEPLIFTEFPALGLARTYNAGSYITDSASAATAMASGRKTSRGAVNASPDGKEAYTPITYTLKNKGYKIGVVTSVALNHATPAAFYAMGVGRGDAYAIAEALADSGFDYFGGGGIAQARGRNYDKPDVLKKIAEKYAIVSTKEGMRALKPGVKAVAINEVLNGSAMPFAIDGEKGSPSLADHTEKAIEMLDNEKGFFLMVEGGNIDYACHANDAAAAVKEVLAFDEAVGKALEFYKKHPKDTLIVVTGDHETGGMSVGYISSRFNAPIERLALQKGSHKKFINDIFKPYAEKNASGASLAHMKKPVMEFFGIDLDVLSGAEKASLERALVQSLTDPDYDWRNKELYMLYGGNDPFSNELLKIFNAGAGIGWTTYVHTGQPVPVFAIGANSELFKGYYENTDIYAKILEGVK